MRNLALASAALFLVQFGGAQIMSYMQNDRPKKAPEEAVTAPAPQPPPEATPATPQQQ